SESRKEQRLKRVRIGDEMEDDEYAPCIEVPPVLLEENSSKKSKKTRKYRLTPAPIKDVTELEIAKYIQGLPCGLTIGQAMAQVPKYYSSIKKSMQRKCEANMADDPKAITTAARC